MHGRRYLLIGGRGFVGSHLVRALLADARTELITLVDSGRTAVYREVPGHDRIEVRDVDAGSIPALAFECLRHSYDFAVQLAVVPLVYSISEPVSAFGGVLAPQQAILECARLGYVPRLLLFSSCEVYGGGDLGEHMDESRALKPHTTYAAAKASGDLLADSYARCFGTKHVTLRLFNQIGTGKQVLRRGGIVPQAIRALRDGSPLLLFNPTATRDFVPVMETVRACQLVLDDFDSIVGETINVCTGTIHSMQQVVADLERISGSSIRVEQAPPREGDVDHFRGDGAKALDLLGFAPVVRWDEILRACLQASA